MFYRLSSERRVSQLKMRAVVARGLGVLGFAVAFSGASVAQARVITVDLFGERAPGQVGQCTLRDAVNAVNLNTAVQGCPGPDGDFDTILLLPGTYTVTMATTSSTLTLSRPVNIEGNGFEATTVTTSAGGQSVPLFKVASPSVTLRGLKFYQIKGGEALTVAGGGVASFYDSHIVESGQNLNGAGCISNYGSLVMSSVEISKCRGWMSGAILNQGWMYMDSSTVLESDASRNGAILNDGSFASLYMYNSTLAKNQAPQHATALTNSSNASAELTAVTVVDNTRPAQANTTPPALRNTGGTLKLKNSVVARNNTDTVVACSGTITSLGYNYLGSGSEVCAVANTVATDKKSGPMYLSPLARVGGVTRVMVPQNIIGNALLNHIPPGQCPFSDQRGLQRSNFGSNCDIGAANRGRAKIVIDNPAAPRTEDQKMAAWLNAAGIDTSYLDDSNAAPTLNNAGESLVIISTTVDDATIGTKYKNAPIGVVVNKVSALDNMSMVAAGALGIFFTQKTVAVPFNGEYFHHKIGNFPNLLNEGGGGWGSPESTATWMVYYMFNTKPCVFRYGKGVAATGGFVMPAGRIAFPGWPSLFTGSGSNDEDGVGTNDGKETFYEVVMWASRAK
jgi:hypothetical protein